jgi:VanZ family protein
LKLPASVLEKTAPAPQKSGFRAWLPTMIWLAMIVSFSTDTFSAEHTGSILERVVRALYGPISPHHFLVLHVFVRKAAHFSVYGLLSLLAFYSWRATLPRRVRWTFTWSLLALGVALLAGSYDEIHQIFVPSRTPSPYDVMLDMAGALFVQIVIASFTKPYKKQSALSI